MIGMQLPATDDRHMRALGIGQFAIGVAALLTPQSCARFVGSTSGRAGGAEAFAWRMFGARQVCLGAGGVAGVQAARDVNLVLQPIDLAIFAHAYTSGATPRRVARSGLVAASFALLNAAVHRRRRSTASAPPGTVPGPA
jgi:hypothetical protein